MSQPDDGDEDLPGGTPVEDPDPEGMPEPAGHPLTARDAWALTQKRID